MSGKGHAVAVLVESNGGEIPLIRDPKKRPPLYWKLPGGRGEAGEEAEAVALRELEEETGIVLPKGAVSLVLEQDRENHIFSLFRAKVPSLSKLKAVGNEGEEICTFGLDQLLVMRDFFPNHRKALQEARLL